jgi:hypothetical protein
MPQNYYNPLLILKEFLFNQLKMSIFNINEKTKIFIISPSGVSTGGPEGLHQLAFELLNKGHKVYMYYVPNNKLNPCHDNYIKFKIPVFNLILEPHSL